MPRRVPTAPQRRAYDAVARHVDARIAGCDLTGTVIAAVMYVDHATHSARMRTAELTAVALCAAGTHLDRSDALTLALYRYAESGAYARAWSESP